MSYVANLVMYAITFFFKTIFDAIAQPAFKALSQLMITPSGSITGNPYVGNLIAYAQAIVGIWFATLVAWHTYRAYLLRSAGASNQDPGTFLRRVFTAGFLVAFSPWLLELMIRANNAIVLGLANAGVDTSGISQHFANLFVITMPVGAVTSALMGIVLFGLIFVVAAVVLWVMYLIRTAELMVLAFIGPLLAVSVLNGDDGTAWDTWLKEAAIAIFTQSAHMAMLYLFFNLIGGSNDMSGYAFAAGLLVVMIRGPAALRNYMHATGVGAASVAAGTMAGQLMVYKVMAVKGLAGAIPKAA